MRPCCRSACRRRSERRAAAAHSAVGAAHAWPRRCGTAPGVAVWNLRREARIRARALVLPLSRRGASRGQRRSHAQRGNRASGGRSHPPRGRHEDGDRSGDIGIVPTGSDRSRGARSDPPHEQARGCTRPAAASRALTCAFTPARNAPLACEFACERESANRGCLHGSS
jgi:hypothetical protein